jgi:cyclohexyl-isocyanide hydratase
LAFPKIQQLNLTRPFEMFASVPAMEARLVWNRVERIVTATGLVLTPDLTFVEYPRLDRFGVFCRPNPPTDTCSG